MERKLRSHTHELLDLGVIRPSVSPWCAPSVTVGNKDGSLRLCQDYRPLNAVTTPDPYQMKRVDDTLDLLGEASFLTKLDLSKGYYQILVRADHVQKTAFSTLFGKFEYVRMPFGLKNAPAHFQRCMDVVLDDDFEYSSAYIDDVVVFSRSWEVHIEHLESVLKALSSHGFTIKPGKCTWAAQSIEYLGFAVGDGKLSVPEARIQSIQAITQPTTITQLRSFLGTLGDYRRFVPKFASLAASLTPATKKDQPKNIVWTPEMSQSYICLKQSLSSVLCLYISNSSDCFTLVTDASGRGIGAVLCLNRVTLDVPVAFYSRQLRDQETRYTASEMEGLAVIEAVKHFEIHLFGCEFKVVTDHRALTCLFSSSVLNFKLWRWALYLQQVSIQFVYLPGRFNMVVDCLSHQTWPAAVSVDRHSSIELDKVICPTLTHLRDDFSMAPSTQRSALPEDGLVSGSHPKTKEQEDVPSTSEGGDVGGVPHTNASPT